MSVTAANSAVAPVGYVDSSPEARAMTVAGGAPQAAVFMDLRTALASTDADAVLVTAGIRSHVPLALEALEMGAAVLLEKPFAPTLGEAVSAVRAAATAGRVLMISQNYRYHPAPRLAARLVAVGEVGDLVGVEVDFRRPLFRRVDWLEHHRGLDHPLLADMAIHHFDLMRMVLGCEPVSVSIEPINPASSRYRDPPAAFGTLIFDSGVPVSYRGSWISHTRRTPWGGEWRIEGTRGAIEWRSRGDPGVRDALHVRRPGRVDAVPLPEFPALDRAGALAAFVDAVRSGAEPETSGRRNLRTLALTLATMRSATERRQVEVRELVDELPEDLR
jgi:predicted dehydrogenase